MYLEESDDIEKIDLSQYRNTTIKNFDHRPQTSDNKRNITTGKNNTKIEKIEKTRNSSKYDTLFNFFF